LNWKKAYTTLAGESVYRQQLKNGLWKIYAAFDASGFAFGRDNIEATGIENIKLNNKNLYFNTSYSGTIWNSWQLFTGISHGYSDNFVSVDDADIEGKEHGFHIKANLGKRISNGIRVQTGLDYFRTVFDENYMAKTTPSFNSRYDRQQIAGFIEADILFTRNLAEKVCFRYSYYGLLKESRISPMFS